MKGRKNRTPEEYKQHLQARLEAARLKLRDLLEVQAPNPRVREQISSIRGRIVNIEQELKSLDYI